MICMSGHTSVSIHVARRHPHPGLKLSLIIPGHCGVSVRGRGRRHHAQPFHSRSALIFPFPDRFIPASCAKFTPYCQWNTYSVHEFQLLQLGNLWLVVLGHVIGHSMSCWRLLFGIRVHAYLDINSEAASEQHNL